jgi:DNA-binding NtrC family response regulator
MMKRILVVDDFPGILELLRVYLGSKCNIEIETCHSPVAGIEKMNVKQFDAIISDYDMREMNGIEFLKFIRDQGYSMPFILLTGVNNREVEMAAQEYGALYLQKGDYPIKQLEGLLVTIRKNLEKTGVADLMVNP